MKLLITAFVLFFSLSSLAIDESRYPEETFIFQIPARKLRIVVRHEENYGPYDYGFFAAAVEIYRSGKKIFEGENLEIESDEMGLYRVDGKNFHLHTSTSEIQMGGWCAGRLEYRTRRGHEEFESFYLP